MAQFADDALQPHRLRLLEQAGAVVEARHLSGEGMTVPRKESSQPLLPFLEAEFAKVAPVLKA